MEPAHAPCRAPRAPSALREATRAPPTATSPSRRPSRRAKTLTRPPIPGCSRAPPPTQTPRALQVLNRLITLGGKAGWAKGHTAEQAAAAPERWVTFGSAYSARAAIEEDSLQGAGPARQRLREYLALPADQYSLLDPDWISR